jgi:hypothetical protein
LKLSFFPFLIFVFFIGLAASAEPVALSRTSPVNNAIATPFFEIKGTGERQNPVRWKLHSAFTGDTLFARFRLRYSADSIDTTVDGDGEFFVFWMDRFEGVETSNHSGGVPNVGIHVDKEGKNRFMVRYAARGEAFGPELKGDREFTVVARLEKSASGTDKPFDELSLWVDPNPDKPAEPDAVCRSEAALSTVSWVGFSTAGKTESGDRILVGDVLLADQWAKLFGGDGEPQLSEIPKPPAYTPPEPPSRIVEVDPPPAVEPTDHWSFQPLLRPSIPKPAAQHWVRTPVDAFVAGKHEENGLVPSAPAKDSDLTRRISLVLTGLPPEQIIPSAKVDEYAEQLLRSTAYGERWGRHWLDVARWAESNGHQHNRNRDHAWRYRDWVVQSFIEDKPFDQFLREQIAGDEIEPFDPDHIVATGFLAAARYSGNELDKAIQRNDILVDITNTTAKAFLGLTMECAQCHDHFFDPVTQWDYFQFMSFFAKGQSGDVILLESNPEAKRLVEDRWGLFEQSRSRLAESRRQRGDPEPVLVIPKSVPGGMTAAEKRAFLGIESALASLPKTWGFYSPATSPHELEFAPTAMRWPLPFQKESLETVAVRFLDRGDVNSPGPVAEPRWPQVFGETDAETVSEKPRLALADWLTSPDHPLTARVWVNRIWQWHFGTGLVATSGDFGIAGSGPSHPQLLDWLACELIDSGWSTRHIHRLILQSNTFRQSPAFSAENAARDPDNALLWRWKPRRLEAEAIRDSALAVAGSIDLQIGGKSVPAAESEESLRRSLYLHQRRDNLPHQQMLFDSANAVTSCSKRLTSTVGLQPLWMMNSIFMQQRAVELASRIQADISPEDGPDTAVRRLVQQTLLREASPGEISGLTSLIRDSSLVEAATVLLNTNEFLYIP